MDKSIEKFDEVFEIVVSMAKTKMMMNSHKGDISDISSDVLLDCTRREIIELKQAIDDGNYVHIIEEVADVMNFAVASAYHAIQDYRNRNEKTT